MVQFLRLLITFTIAVGCFPASTLLASCGDWLWHPQQVERDHSRLNLDREQAFVKFGLLAVEPHMPKPRMPEPTGPCNGPQCKQAPSSPSLLPVSVSQRTSETPAGLGNDSLQLFPTWSRAELYSSLIVTSGNRLVIERPPIL